MARRRRGSCGCLALGGVAVLLLATCSRRTPDATPVAQPPIAQPIPVAAVEDPAIKKARARWWIQHNREERRKRQLAERAERQRQAAEEKRLMAEWTRQAERLQAEQQREDALTRAAAQAGEQEAYVEPPQPQVYYPQAESTPAAAEDAYLGGVNPNTHIVRGHYRNGRYIAPYVRTNPNGITSDNLGSSRRRGRR